MIYTGLVSVTFRKNKPEEIIECVKKAGLDGIEWGGDVHVPHGDIRQAARVLKLTRDAGLKVASYGSYYRMGKDNGFSFKQVLETAKALEAPAIRVWAGNTGSVEADDTYWDSVVRESIQIVDVAGRENIRVAFEFHRNTLNDTGKSSLELLKRINHINAWSYWQPSSEMNAAERLESLEMVLPKLLHIHVYYNKDGKRLGLESGLEEWVSYISTVQKTQRDHYAMIEFVRDDSPQQFLDDAAVLKRLIRMEDVIDG